MSRLSRALLVAGHVLFVANLAMWKITAVREGSSMTDALEFGALLTAIYAVGIWMRERIPM